MVISSTVRYVTEFDVIDPDFSSNLKKNTTKQHCFQKEASKMT